MPIFLEFGNQLISLLDDVSVLLVFVIWPVRFDDPVDSIDCAGYTVSRDEFGQVPEKIPISIPSFKGTAVTPFRTSSRGHTGLRIQQILQNRWPCSGAQLHDNFAEAADNLATSSPARTILGARRDIGLD